VEIALYCNVPRITCAGCRRAAELVAFCCCLLGAHPHMRASIVLRKSEKREQVCGKQLLR